MFDKKGLYLLLVVVGIVIAECIGQSCLRSMFDNPSKVHMFAAGLASYSVVCYLLILSYNYKGMGLINVLWSGLSVLAILAAGALFFHEKVTTMDMIGVVLTLAGIALIIMEE